ncbi:YicC/YloC family endoribonuclease [Marinospirillum sp. MEB164]|uniref:YicC/YloC family endoribonuclease n=1 Tax=Marinospirillum alkalitolerans TaxID=3123374 RepID=A0ABW8PVF9_9GAMM
MTASMTAFARCEEQHPWGHLSWEIRSVNQRYLEPQFRLPETLRVIEPELRQRLRKHLARGKLDITLRFQPAVQGDRLQLNSDLLNQLLQASQQIEQAASVHQVHTAAINPLELMQWSGVLQATETDEEALHAAALALFEQALGRLQEHRLREGAALAEMIVERLDQIAQHLEAAQQHLPEALAAWRAQLQERAAQLGQQVEPQRLEQELVLLAQKQDIAEELDRLKTHLVEVRRALKSQQPVGRRLDFLMQEMNREANTLGSKAMSMEMTQTSVDLKVLIEQMREQIQNIE